MYYHRKGEPDRNSAVTVLTNYCLVCFGRFLTVWRDPTVDVRDERYKVNHCSETEEIPNQVERRWSRMEWSRVSKAADRSRRQR